MEGARLWCVFVWFHPWKRLSMFTGDEEIRERMETGASGRGYEGPCCSGNGGLARRGSKQGAAVEGSTGVREGA